MIPNSRAIISRIYFHKLYTIDQTKCFVRSGFDSRRKIGKKKKQIHTNHIFIRSKFISLAVP